MSLMSAYEKDYSKFNLRQLIAVVIAVLGTKLGNIVICYHYFLIFIQNTSRFDAPQRTLNGTRMEFKNNG